MMHIFQPKNGTGTVGLRLPCFPIDKIRIRHEFTARFGILHLLIKDKKNVH